MDIESKYKNESPLQLLSKLNSLDAGEKKTAQKTYLGPKENQPFFYV